MTLSHRTPPVSNSMFISCIIFAAALYTLVLVGILLRQTRPRHPGRLFAFFLFWIALWMLAGGIMLLPFIDRTVALWTARAAFFCDIGWAIGWVWFTSAFPTPSPRFRLVALVLALLGLPWLALVWTPLVVETTTAAPWGHHLALAHPVSDLFAVWLIACLATGVAAQAWALRTHTGRARQQVQYLLLGVSSSAAISLTFCLILPLLHRTTELLAPGMLGSLLLTTAVTTAIVRHRLMGLTFLVRRAAVYLLSVALLLATFAAVSALPLTALDAQPRLLLVLALALAWYPLFRLVQGLLDRVVFHTVATYRQVVRASGERFATVREPRALVELLSRTLREALAPHAFAVYLPTPDGGLALAQSEGENWPNLLPVDDPALGALRQHDAIRLTHEALEADDPIVGRALLDWGVDVAAPLVAHGRLCGLVLLAGKRLGDAYTTEDLELLYIIAKGAALALDNATQYQALQVANADLEARVQGRTQELMATNTALAASNAALEYANTALVAEQAYLATAIDILPMPLCFLVQEGDTVRALRSNRALACFLEEHRVTTVESIRLADPDTHALLPPAAWPHARALAGEVVASAEYLTCMPGGREIPVVCHAAPIQLDGRVTAAVVAFQDISSLKAADQAKDAFLAQLSHELLTPLTSILGWTEMGLAQQDVATAHQALEVVARNARRQRRLIFDLLDLSRLHHRTLHLQCSPLDLPELAAQTVMQFLPMASAQRLTLEYVPCRHPLAVSGDTDRLMQVLCTVIQRALSVTGEGGYITVACAGAGDSAQVMVTDTGGPLTPEELDAALQPIPGDERASDLGLGVLLTRGLVEMHGGTMTIASNDRGSTVTVTLPRLASAVEA